MTFVCRGYLIIVSHLDLVRSNTSPFLTVRKNTRCKIKNSKRFESKAKNFFDQTVYDFCIKTKQARDCIHTY